MIDYAPSEKVPELKPMTEQIYEKKDYADIKTFKTREEAIAFREKHGGFVIKQYDRRFSVIYIPKGLKNEN